MNNPRRINICKSEGLVWRQQCLGCVLTEFKPQAGPKADLAGR